MKEKIIKLIEDVLKVPAGTITEDTMIEDVEQWDSLADSWRKSLVSAFP